MRELLAVLAMICGLSCTPAPEHEQRVQCGIACKDYGDLVSMGRSDDLVQLLCTCGDGSTQIGAVDDGF